MDDMIDICIAIWNARGLNSLDRRLAVSQAISPSRAVVVCLQETKKATISDRVVRDCLGPVFDGFFYLPAEGTRGGILLAWQSALVSISNPHLTMNAIMARITFGGGHNWWFIGVYGPQSDMEKRSFLQELQYIRKLHVGPSVVAGDFNLIVNPKGKHQGILHRRMMGSFRRTLSNIKAQGSVP
jgi:exonuclease III